MEKNNCKVYVNERGTYLSICNCEYGQAFHE